jgi:hypothetical protein
MRWLAAILAAVALPAIADIAPVISWPVDVTQTASYALTLRRGETVILQPDYNQDLTGASAAVLRYRAVGTATTYATTGTVYSATGGVVRVRLDVTVSNAVYQYEIAVVSSNATLLRSYGKLTVVDSMSGEIPTTPPSGTGDTLAPSEPEGVYPNDIAPVIGWDVDTTEVIHRDHTLISGETVILQPHFIGKDFSNAIGVAMRYRPIGARGWAYVAPGTIHDATGGVARVRWDSSLQGTNSQYQYEIAVQDAHAMLLRSYGTITILSGLSGATTTTPVRINAIDWATIDNSNLWAAPFWTKASLTNNTANLSVKSLLIDGVPAGSGGGSGTGGVSQAYVDSTTATNAVSGDILTISSNRVTLTTGALSNVLAVFFAQLYHFHGWGSITNTPTTLGGFGITDAATASQGAKADTALQSYTETDPLFAALSDSLAYKSDLGTMAYADTENYVRIDGFLYTQTVYQAQTAFGWGPHDGLYAPISHQQPLSTITNAGTAAAHAAEDFQAAGSYAPATHTQSWVSITGTPTTVSGFGITDAAPISHLSDSNNPHGVTAAQVQALPNGTIRVTSVTPGTAITNANGEVNVKVDGGIFETASLLTFMSGTTCTITRAMVSTNSTWTLATTGTTYLAVDNTLTDPSISAFFSVSLWIGTNTFSFVYPMTNNFTLSTTTTNFIVFGKGAWSTNCIGVGHP